MLRLTRALVPSLMATLVAVTAGTAQAAAPDLTAAIQGAQQALRDALAQEFPVAEIVVRQEDGPFDTVIAVAAYPKAYPGTGVKRVALDRKTGVRYGANGERSFADFAREHGWLATPPDTEALVRFMNTLLFDGVAIFDTQTPPTARVKDGRLELETVQRWMPSNSGQRLIVTVAASGPESIERRPLPR